MRCLLALLLPLWYLPACKAPYPLYCQNSPDCTTDPSRPFCDTTGEFSGQGGNVCIAEPFDGALPSDSCVVADCTGKCGSDVPDNCGGFLECGDPCTDPDSCGGGGTLHECGCTQRTCGAMECGSLADGCGAMMDCGICALRDRLGLGFSHTCARFNSGEVKCWGSSGAGQLGYEGTQALGGAPGDMPTAAVDLGGTANGVVAAGSFTCAMVELAGVQCWGFNGAGQLGLGHTNNIGDNPGEMPPVGASYPSGAARLAAGDNHVCLVHDGLGGGIMRCWGSGLYGQTGHEDTATIGDDEYSFDSAFLVLPEPILDVAAGSAHTCAIGGDSTVRCFGLNSDGQLGLGHTSNTGDELGEMPPPAVAVVGIPVQVAAGAQHSCVLLADATVRCWGRNDWGQLGHGHSDTVGDDAGELTPPTVTIGATATQLALGGAHSCALLHSGAVRCWGRNDFGQLGYEHNRTIGDEPGEMPPQDVELGGRAVSIAAGGNHTCAVMETGYVRCWGSGQSGQLGNETTNRIGDDPGEMPPPDANTGGPLF